jgi:hypothetical protein
MTTTKATAKALNAEDAKVTQKGAKENGLVARIRNYKATV